MMANVKSGNCCQFEFKRYGDRIVINAEWRDEPTHEDMEELNNVALGLLPSGAKVTGSLYAERRADVARLTHAMLNGGVN